MTKVMLSKNSLDIFVGAIDGFLEASDSANFLLNPKYLRRITQQFLKHSIQEQGIELDPEMEDLIRLVAQSPTYGSVRKWIRSQHSIGVHQDYFANVKGIFAHVYTAAWAVSDRLLGRDQQLISGWNRSLDADELSNLLEDLKNDTYRTSSK